MSISGKTVGIIGGTGMLGRTITHALLDREVVAPDRLWISNRSGSAGDFACNPAVTFTSDNQALTEACDVILLSVPPAMAGRIGISADDKLVISVMAGITRADITRITGARRTVRAMSSPAAEHRLAYSPWIASPAASKEDRTIAAEIFLVCGETDEVDDEDHIDVFTALTGPVPGFVALFAEAMVDYATGQGIAPAIADRAIRQLFLSGGYMMARGKPAPADHVREMIDYAGTTAAGLTKMRDSALTRLIFEGLDASVDKTRDMGT